MKAAFISALNEPVLIQNTEKPSAQAGEAVVKIFHAALNHRDIWITKGQYAGIKLPVIPGSDGCGIVVETGSPEDGSWIGKEVIIHRCVRCGKEKKNKLSPQDSFDVFVLVSKRPYRDDGRQGV